MTNLHLWRAVIIGLAFGLASCSSDAGDQGSDSTNDGGTHDADAEGDALDGIDADDASSGCVDFPSPAIAGTSQTDALASAPSRCGRADYSWISSPDLGEVTAIGDEEELSAAAIEGILSSEGVEPPREVAHSTRVVQYEYATQDRGQRQLASSMVAYPVDRDPSEGPLDVLLFLHGTTGFTDACAPSNDLAYRGLAALLASFGYFVVAPDFIGLKGLGEETGFLHPYLVGQATAIASLDAVRAAANLPGRERGDLCLSQRVVAFGASQGGHAALWVDRLAPYYARELDLLGAVATVPPADMLGQMERAVDELVDATGNTVGFLGASAGWYGHRERLDEVFVSPLDEEVPETLETTCDFSEVVDEPESTADIFTPELIDTVDGGGLADYDPWGCIVAENGLPSTSIERIEPDDSAYGVMFVLAEEDGLVHTPIERAAFDELCEEGMQMQFLECAGAGHGEATLFALPEILDFVDARMAGETFDSTNICERTDPVECRGTP